MTDRPSERQIADGARMRSTRQAPHPVEPVMSPPERRAWEVVSLRDLGPRAKIQPTVGGIGLVYRGGRHIFSGPPESGKTFAAYAILLEEARLGGLGILIDFEMGPWDARDRLREMGATDHDLDQLRYVSPDTAATPEAIAGLVSLDPTLVVIDAVAGAYDCEGLDDNSRRDVERWTSLYIAAFRRHGAATIMLDHVVKNPDSRGRYAIGSERKSGAADVHLGFNTITPLTRGRTGRFAVTTHKDRFGHLPRGRVADFEVSSHPVSHAVSWKFAPTSCPETAPGQDALRAAALSPHMSRILEVIDAHPEGVSRSVLYTMTKGKRASLVSATAALIDQGRLIEKEGLLTARAGGQRYAARESARSQRPCPPGSLGSLGSQAVPDPFPIAAASPVPAVPPFREGGTGTGRGTPCAHDDPGLNGDPASRAQVDDPPPVRREPAPRCHFCSRGSRDFRVSLGGFEKGACRDCQMLYNLELVTTAERGCNQNATSEAATPLGSWVSGRDVKPPYLEANDSTDDRGAAA